MRRRLGLKRLQEIAGGYLATHDVETVPMAEEIIDWRAEIDRMAALVRERNRLQRQRAELRNALRIVIAAAERAGQPVGPGLKALAKAGARRPPRPVHDR